MAPRPARAPAAAGTTAHLPPGPDEVRDAARLHGLCGRRRPTGAVQACSQRDRARRHRPVLHAGYKRLRAAAGQLGRVTMYTTGGEPADGTGPASWTVAGHPRPGRGPRRLRLGARPELDVVSDRRCPPATSARGHGFRLQHDRGHCRPADVVRRASGGAFKWSRHRPLSGPVADHRARLLLPS